MKKLLMTLIALVAVIATIFLVAQGNKPEFFDIFGLIVFVFLFAVGFLMIKKQKLPNWVGFLILLIGILGLIVDGSIVIKTYFLGG